MNNNALKVLLVEDNPSDAVLMQATLGDPSAGHFDVVHVETMASALQQLTTNQFDIVLSDLGLPDSQGPKTFLRLHEVCPQLPIIILSGLDDEQVALSTVHAGAQDYLVKGQVPAEWLVRTMRYAIERKQAQEQLRRQNEEMSADLAMAREFQQAFLPRKFPVFPSGASMEGSALRFCQCYLASGSVGGDFYMVLPLSETTAGLFLCDVMGHGVRASLVTAIIRGLVEELKTAAADPGQFLTQVNTALVEVLRQTDTTLFATAFYLVVDAAAGEARFSSAGHPHPFHLQTRAGTARVLPQPQETIGSVLGLFDNTVYATARLTLEVDDRILLFTDGIFEVPDADDKEYGEERLLEAVRARLALPASQLFDELLTDVLRYAATGEFADDVCLLSVKFAKRL